MRWPLCRLGRWQDGIVELREVLRVDPDNSDSAKALYIATEQAKTQPVDSRHILENKNRWHIANGFERVLLKEGENHHAGHGYVEPDEEGQARDSAVHGEPNRPS